MAEESVQNQSSESKDREERMLVAFRKLPPEVQDRKLWLIEYSASAYCSQSRAV